MSKVIWTLVAITVVVTVVVHESQPRGGESPAFSAEAQSESDRGQTTPSTLGEIPSLGQMPPYFIENIGQFPQDAKFVMKRRGTIAAFTTRGVSLAAKETRKDDSIQWHLAAFDFLASGHEVEPVGGAPLASNSNYFLGNDAAAWHTGARHFEKLVYEGIAPGVDLVVLARDGELAYDLMIEEGADVSAVEFVARGCSGSRIDETGALEFQTEIGTVRHTAPNAWYELVDGKREPVLVRFDRRGEDRFGFHIDSPRLDARLVIDPGLMWSTYFGGDEFEDIYALDFDAGFVTVAGRTSSDNSSFPVYPTTAPPNLQTNLIGTAGQVHDAFVARLDPSQQGAAQLVWATYLGGTFDEEIKDVVVDANGNFAAVGLTYSANFPVTAATAIQSSHPLTTGMTGFVTYVTVGSGPALSLTYSTYYGHTATETWINAVDLNAGRVITFGGAVATNAYVGGNIPFQSPTAAVQPWDPNPSNWFYEGFFARIDRGDATATPPIPAKVVYATYLSLSSPSGPTYPPGNGLGSYEEVYAIKCRGGFVYVGGQADSPDMNFPSDAFKQFADFNTVRWDGYVMQFDTTDPVVNQQLKYGTFIGGNVPIPSGTGTYSPANDIVYDIDVVQGAIYACGRTSALDFPVTTYSSSNVEAPGYWHFPPTYMTDYAFVVKLIPRQSPGNPSRDLRYGTYLGGSFVSWAHAIRRVSSMGVVVAGFTSSNGATGQAFPTGTSGSIPYDSTHNGGSDGFVTYLNWSAVTPPPTGHPVASQLRYSTFLGSLDNDECRGLAIDGLTTYVGGFTFGTNFPTTASTLDSTLNGAKDGFVAAFGLPATWP